MNIVQKNLLEIAKKYISVCEYLNLRYFAIGGTALGAVRHNGFIPWDDDIDFAMPRKDFEILKKAFNDYFGSEFLLQDYESNNDYPYTFAKIRDKRIKIKSFVDNGFNIEKSLWIDIFILDGLPDSDKKIKLIALKKKYLFRPRYLSRHYNWKWYSFPYLLMLIILFPSKKRTYKRDVRQLSRFDFDNSKYVWDNWFYLYHKGKIRKIPSWFFSDYKIIGFENIGIRVPQAYSDYLTYNYGNWKQLPPLEEQKPKHGIVILEK